MIEKIKSVFRPTAKSFLLADKFSLESFLKFSPEELYNATKSIVENPDLKKKNRESKKLKANLIEIISINPFFFGGDKNKYWLKIFEHLQISYSDFVIEALSKIPLNLLVAEINERNSSSSQGITPPTSSQAKITPISPQGITPPISSQEEMFFDLPAD